MSDLVISNKVMDRLSEITLGDNSIVVLKGIPLYMLDKATGKIDLSKVIDNKFEYFATIYRKRKFLLYEEFLLISDFIISQYKEIYILNNNIYMEQYPLEDCFTPEVKSGLLTHFGETDEGDNDDSYIGDIGEYIALYEGVKEHNGYLVGVYSETAKVEDLKVTTINLFEKNSVDIAMVNDKDNSSIECEIIEESDYVDFIEMLFLKPKSLYLRIYGYTGDINRLKDKIELVAYYWKKYTDIYYVQPLTVNDKFEHREEYIDILKRYWGYSSYRDLPVYEMSKLEHGEKEVIHVSQENIISNLVKQVENCEGGNDFRDIFVTAPTGAGKSVMFQVPAIYLAEKYNLLTIVISPLIGLMNDQVKNLELKSYKYAKTINSDISPIVKQDIIDKVAEGKYHILYISPETLLSRSDVEQLIGKRTIGMIIIDEAHIVTTWGKQFRPDYWYLGDHIKKLRKKQIENPDKQRSFVVATFTATAIYHGLEDMYTETINSLHMLNPITYLGYIKRHDIEIKIVTSKKEKGERTEYELDKFEQIENILKRAIITNKKTLIYFPTVALIERCYEYLRSKREAGKVTKYYGTLKKDEKQENYEKFYVKEKLVMLATKAFGMGIDINDIELVVHFAPTGNVCDYVQEIGRAARKEELQGEAYYNYNSRDFKHINRLHGLSTIRPFQLIKVIEKIDELYYQSIKGEKRSDFTKKRNAMLLDAENFSYIFGSPIGDEDNNINKVKTALLLIQKDFESKVGFSPIQVRPIPMFSIGFFEVDTSTQRSLKAKYPNAIEEIEPQRHICRIILSEIWRKDYTKLSFPKFKYELYTKNEELDLVSKYPMNSVLCVRVFFEENYTSKFKNIWGALKKYILKKVQTSEHTAISDITDMLEIECKINKYKAQAICEVIIASMDCYRNNFTKTCSPIVQEKTTKLGKTKYQFNVAVNSYFHWFECGVKKVESETKDGYLYLVNDVGNRTKEYSVILGILEALNCLSFEMLGGANSQLYIYINQIQALKNIINAPYRYNNRLLNTVSDRHLISVKMLTYIYEGGFKNDEIWNIIEDYFLGIIPEKVKMDCKKEKPGIIFE